MGTKESDKNTSLKVFFNIQDTLTLKAVADKKQTSTVQHSKLQLTAANNCDKKTLSLFLSLVFFLFLLHN